MVVQFYNPKLKSNKKYHGEIKRYTLDKERKIFRVYVVLDEVPEIEYMKRFEFDLNVSSELGEFLDNTYVLSEDGLADFDDLEGLRVIVKLKKGTNDKFYVNMICLDDEYYEQKESDYEEN